MANTSIDLVNLDFDTLKNDFKSFLKSQDEFKDYDFDGSNINVLLDLLSYNTYKNAFFLNMNFAESFIDSAQLKDSVFSHAKALNYTPRSARSAKARVSVNFTASGESQPYIIQKGHSFTTVIKNESFVFSIPESLIVASSNTSFSFETDVYEGIYLKDSHIFTNDAENQRFRVSNKNVDTDSITVMVYEDNSLLGTKYIKTDTLLDLNENSKVFFLQASENGYYEIIFGDNNLGKQPKINSTIVIDYRVANAKRANGAKNFIINFDPTGDSSELLSTPEISTITYAGGGDDAESNDSVRFYAPRHFQIQQRTIVSTDYEIALKTQFPEINAVACIGGEDRSPPQFGKIFIAVDLKEADGLPESKLLSYYNFIRARSPLKPIFIEPEFTHFRITSTVRYNTNITSLSKTTIKTLVINNIMNYSDKNLNDFGVTLRKSKFIEDIDNIDDSFISNITEIYPYKKLSPKLAEYEKHSLDFGFALDNSFGLTNSVLLSSDADKHLSSKDHAVFSSNFRYNGLTVYLKDDGAGNVRIVKRDGDYDIKIINVGSVDYDTGKIALTSLKIDDYDTSYFKIYVTPKDPDIIIPKDTLSYIESDEVDIIIEELKE